MTAYILLMSAGLIGCSVLLGGNAGPDDGAPAHVRNEFEFIANGAQKVVAPLFGPEGERVWAGKDWNPVFIYPQPGRDIQGAVFTIKHGDHQAVWVNTVFDPAAGHIQYVYVMNDLLSTTIELHLSQLDAGHTRVHVAYERTALRREASDHVKSMGAADARNAKEWESSINDYLKKSVRSGNP